MLNDGSSSTNYGSLSLWSYEFSQFSLFFIFLPWTHSRFLRCVNTTHLLLVFVTLLKPYLSTVIYDWEIVLRWKISWDDRIETKWSPRMVWWANFQDEESSSALSFYYSILCTEICLLTEERRVATVRSETYCSLYSLSVDNFQMILNEYPEMRKTMEQIALRRLSKIGRSSSLLRSKLHYSAETAKLMFALPAGR